MAITLADLRRYAVARSLFGPTTLQRALEHMGFVQADPIRAPARAQDLILRHRVRNYHAGDLERRYEKLGVHEDFFINYGFVTTRLQALMHPRADCNFQAQIPLPWPAAERRRAKLVLEFVRDRGIVHPRDLDEHFAHGKVRNYWGGNSNATTHLLDAMHYQGLLRVVRRQQGIRLYAVQEHAPGPADEALQRAQLDALVDAVVHVYAPLPASSLNVVIRRLRYAAPQWEHEIPAALERARKRLAHDKVEGIGWFWPEGESPRRKQVRSEVRLLAPFDPIVWDRARFEFFWKWTYRFEAYTPIAKRVRGYYALPLLWRDQVIGWGNLSVHGGELKADLGYVKGHPPREKQFHQQLAAELGRLRDFLRLTKAIERASSKVSLPASSPQFRSGNEKKAERPGHPSRSRTYVVENSINNSYLPQQVLCKLLKSRKTRLEAPTASFHCPEAPNHVRGGDRRSWGILCAAKDIVERVWMGNRANRQEQESEQTRRTSSLPESRWNRYRALSNGRVFGPAK